MAGIRGFFVALTLFCSAAFAGDGEPEAAVIAAPDVHAADPVRRGADAFERAALAGELREAFRPQENSHLQDSSGGDAPRSLSGEPGISFPPDNSGSFPPCAVLRRLPRAPPRVLFAL